MLKVLGEDKDELCGVKTEQLWSKTQYILDVTREEKQDCLQFILKIFYHLRDLLVSVFITLV